LTRGGVRAGGDPTLAGLAFEYTVDQSDAPIIVLMTTTDTYRFVRRK